MRPGVVIFSCFSSSEAPQNWSLLLMNTKIFFTLRNCQYWISDCQEYGHYYLTKCNYDCLTTQWWYDLGWNAPSLSILLTRCVFVINNKRHKKCMWAAMENVYTASHCLSSWCKLHITLACPKCTWGSSMYSSDLGQSISEMYCSLVSFPD